MKICIYQNKARIAFCATFILFSLTNLSHAQNTPKIDLNKIKQIESSGNPLAHNKKSGARGCMQFRKIAWVDVHNHYPSLKKYDYLTYSFNPKVSQLFAEKYFEVLRRYLRNYKIPINTLTLICAWNWGIGNTKKWHRRGGKLNELPQETRKYYKKYEN